MGRIEEALAKLRAQPREIDRARSVGAVVPRAAQEAVTAQERRYGGKRLQFDVNELRRQGFLASDGQEQQLVDQYRAIKRPLLRTASAGSEAHVEKGNLLMVASAFSGEGKTFTCVNLCLSIARERDWSVVLVDGDCLKPELTKLLGAENEPGLMDALKDPGIDIESLIMPTDVPGLAILPAGARDLHAAELLASSRMTALCSEMSAADPHRIVIFDSAPLLLTSEATVLATQVGQVVLVVRANRTPQKAVLEAKERLDPSKAVCVLLNQCNAGESLVQYGEYGYGA